MNLNYKNIKEVSEYFGDQGMQREQSKLMKKRTKEKLDLKQRHKKELIELRKALSVVTHSQKKFMQRYASKTHVNTSLQVNSAMYNITYGKQCILNGLRNLHSAERVALLMKHRDNGIL